MTKAKQPKEQGNQRRTGLQRVSFSRCSLDQVASVVLAAAVVDKVTVLPATDGNTRVILISVVCLFIVAVIMVYWTP